MLAELDALLTALYVLVDDLLPARSGPGRKPKITDAELITLAIAQIFLDCPSERRFLRFARERLGHLFPYLPGQPAYNRRLRKLAPAICQVIGQLARSSPSFGDRLRLLDSTPVPCGASRETVKRSELAGFAAYGYCASHSRYFWGLRLYLVCAPDGMPVAFCLAPANEPEREVAAALLERAARSELLHGQEIFITDKGFAGKEFEQFIHDALGAQLIRPDRQRRTTPLRRARRHPPANRVDQRHAQGPTLARTPRRPHPNRRLDARLPTRPRARRRRLAQLAHRPARPQPDRLRPLNHPSKRHHSSRPARHRLDDVHMGHLP